LLRPRRVCMLRTSAWDAEQEGGEICGVEMGETVQLVQDGDKRFQCVLSRDGRTAWVDAKAASGKPAFKAAAGSGDPLQSVDAFVKAISSRCSDAAQATETKAAQVAAGAKQGPLCDVRPKLLEVSGKLKQELANLDVLKKRLDTAKAAMLISLSTRLLRCQWLPPWLPRVATATEPSHRLLPWLPLQCQWNTRWLQPQPQ